MGNIGEWLDENAPGWIDDHVIIAGGAYDFINGNQMEIAGAILINDLFGVKGLDLDLCNDLDKAALLGLDYTIKETDDIEIFGGGFVGVDRFESFREPGQFMAGVQGGLKF